MPTMQIGLAQARIQQPEARSEITQPGTWDEFSLSRADLGAIRREMELRPLREVVSIFEAGVPTYSRWIERHFREDRDAWRWKCATERLGNVARSAIESVGARDPDLARQFLRGVRYDLNEIIGHEGIVDRIGNAYAIFEAGRLKGEALVLAVRKDSWGVCVDDKFGIKRAEQGAFFVKAGYGVAPTE